MEERMRTKTQLPARALVIGFITFALALLNADKIGEGLVLAVVALVAVRYWARRCADTHMVERYSCRATGCTRTRRHDLIGTCLDGARPQERCS
jgi:hypothetical protein